jgi:hypothetical protein
MAMNFIRNTEHNPTDKVDASPGALREVAPEAASRLSKVTDAIGRVNSAALYMQKSFPREQRVATVIDNPAIAAYGNANFARPAAAVEPVAQPQAQVQTQSQAAPAELLDDKLAYASFDPAKNLINENDVVRQAEEITTQAAAADAARQAASVAYQVPVQRSELDQRTEVGIDGPRVDETVVYATNLQQSMTQPETAAPLAPATDELDPAAIRAMVDSAYNEPYSATNDPYSLAA